MANRLGDTSIRIKRKTKSKIFRARGRLEMDGKKRTIDDVLNDVFDYFLEADAKNKGDL